MVALQALLPPWGAVICAESAHIHQDEGGAPERVAHTKLYTVPAPDGRPQVHLARWPLHGAIQRWPLEGVAPFDTVHDVKATSDHIVFSDLPFATGPEAVGFGTRTQPNADVTRLTIVAKADLAATAPGEPVPVTQASGDR